VWLFLKYSLCNTTTPLISIQTVESNEWPPKKGTTMLVNVTGVLSKEVTAGTWTETIHVSGFPLPPTSGDLSEVKPLPWEKGEIEFDLTSDIPSSAPSASYDVQIKAVDQDKAQIFCVDLTFNLGLLQDAETDSMKTLLPRPPHSAKKKAIDCWKIRKCK